MSDEKFLFPNLYEDDKEVALFSDLSDEALGYKLRQYGSFLAHDVLPRAREQAGRIIGHLAFESMWRDGVFNNTD